MSSGNDRVSRSIFDQIDRTTNRRVLLVADRLRRRLLHGDNFRGVENLDPRIFEVEALELIPCGDGIADQEELFNVRIFFKR